MTDCVHLWKQCDIWKNFLKHKSVFIDYPGKGETVKKFHAKVNTEKGAMLLGVIRGKSAEGLDFKNDSARAVIIVGLPYPPFKDKRIQTKKDFLDHRVKMKLGTLSGNSWYTLQAYRAVNQAAGRVIRHTKDHGAVLFLDARYKDQIQNISPWLQPHLKSFDNPTPAAKCLLDFFTSKAATSTQTKSIPSIVTQTEARSYPSTSDYFNTKPVSKDYTSTFVTSRPKRKRIKIVCNSMTTHNEEEDNDIKPGMK